MQANLIIHTSHQINCTKFINHFFKVQNNHFKHYRHTLVPYYCKDVNHTSNIILGTFIWPIWNTLERTILSNGARFSHTYISGNNFIIEYKPTDNKSYHILGKSGLHLNKIHISDATLRPNSILLFSIPSDTAKPLIQNGLM